MLARLELAVGRPIRRIGLSATLGDMGLARQYLRPDAPADVHIIEADKGGSELRIQLRGYVSSDKDEDVPAPVRAISDHLFTHLRGSDNLVFAGTRQSVEIYADRLRTLCEEAHLPQEFYPHHANLSREHREFVERRLKEGSVPTTAICTSTLELGIDIGDVTCVAQIGAPFSVASLRQRLGRSGRREGNPAILRQYAIETGLRADSNVLDRLRLGLVRAVAMIELLSRDGGAAAAWRASSFHPGSSNSFGDIRAVAQRLPISTDPLPTRPLPIGFVGNVSRCAPRNRASGYSAHRTR